MGYQDQMSGGMGYPNRGMGPGPNMGNMGPGNRMMGPGPGMVRGPGPAQFGGGGPGPGHSPRMMSPGPGGVAQPPRMSQATPMDTMTGPQVSAGQVPGSVAASGPLTGGDTGANVTMTDGGGQQTETQGAAPPPWGQTGATPNPPTSTGKVTPTPQKEVNISTVCRIGQETVEVS